MKRSSFLSVCGALVLPAAALHCGSEGAGSGATVDGQMDVAEEGGQAEPGPIDPAQPVGEPEPGDVPAAAVPETDEGGLGPDDVELTTPEEPAGPPGGEITTPAPVIVPAALDCGPDGWAVENAGPPENRVNYVILADGYAANSVNTTLEEHIQRALDRRFNHESGEPYGRYRKFVNICVMKVVSQSDGIGNGPTPFDGGNGGDRLARVNAQKVNAYLDANLPETFEVDWRAVVLNQGLWENTGSALMLWSGANRDAPGAALHEGGHGFHDLADEYCQSGSGARCGANQPGATGQEFREVNSSGDPTTTGGKWDVWLGTVQKGLKVPDEGATGIQGAFVGSRYVNAAQYRPSANSMMNSLFGDDVDTSFNAVSREQIIFSIWRAVRPVDSTDPPAGPVNAPTALTVNVIDPSVIDVDWEIDGSVVAAHAAGTLNVGALELAPGEHTVLARAYDNANEDLIRHRTGECPDSVTGRYCHSTAWLNSTQTVEWTITVP